MKPSCILDDSEDAVNEEKEEDPRVETFLGQLTMSTEHGHFQGVISYILLSIVPKRQHMQLLKRFVFSFCLIKLCPVNTFFKTASGTVADTKLKEL